MNHRAIVGCAILMGLVSTTVLAQNTLGELLDVGGKKLSKEGVTAALGGAHVTGASKLGGQLDYVYKADGTFSGNATNSQGRGSGVFGTWTVDDSGKLCADYTLTGVNRRGQNLFLLLYQFGSVVSQRFLVERRVTQRTESVFS